MQATEIAQQSALRQSSNGVRYTAFGENDIENADLDRIVQAVPATVAASLGQKAYYFVPLALIEHPGDTHAGDDAEAGTQTVDIAGAAQSPGQQERSLDQRTMIATTYTAEFSDRAICHRNVRLPGKEGSGKEGSGNDGSIDGVFISTRLLGDRFALAFEFFINVGHALVDVAGVPKSFADLVWKQALGNVRGETSQDAWDFRGIAIGGYDDLGVGGTTGEITGKVNGTVKEVGPLAKAVQNDFVEAAFSDAIAIYQLSLAIDFDYAELRERDYPLLAPQALAERLRLVAQLFPPNVGYEFAIRYRRRRN